MKKLIIIINVILFGSIFIACKQNRPEPVVEKYFISFYNEDFEGVKNYVLEEHRPYYDLLKQLVSANDSLSNKEIQVKDINCDITGDTLAICSCIILENNEKEPRKQTVQLKKVDEKWLVDQGKEGKMPSETDGFLQDQNNQIPESTGNENILEGEE